MEDKNREIKVVVITPETIFRGEEEVINHIIDSGSLLHIRKPQLEEERLMCFTEKIAINTNCKNLAIHYNVKIAKTFNLGGCHIRFEEQELYKNQNLRLSCSTHSIEEAKKVENSVIDYCFISPIFDSISKIGYKSSFSIDEINNFARQSYKCVALGGINNQNIELLSNFHSIALLGSVWVIDGDKVDVKESINRFDKIKKRWQELKKYNI